MFEDWAEQIFRLDVLYLNGVNRKGYCPFFGLTILDISMLCMRV